MAGRSRMSGAESRESIRAPTAATACGQNVKEKSQKITEISAPGDDSRAQLREGFHPCSPRAEEEGPRPTMQEDGLPEGNNN